MYYENVMEYLVFSFFIVSKATFSVKESQIFGAYSKWPVWCQSSHGHGQQCKWLSTMDLENGVFLRTIQIRDLTVVGYPAYTHPFSALSALVWFCGKLGQRYMRLHAEMLLKVISLEHYQAQSPCIPRLFSPLTHLSDLQAPATLPGSFFQSRPSTSFSPPLFSSTPRLVCRRNCFSAPTNSLWNLGLLSLPQFSQSQHMIKWMMLSWYLYWIQSMQSLVGRGIIKVYNKATW